MSTNGIARVQYFDKQFLRAQDFLSEQAYHVAMRRRHNIAEHTWGIVRGLDIVQDADGGLFVQPGFAVDGYGRELILNSRKAIAPREFTGRGNVLDVFVVYDRQSSDPAAPGYAGCGNSTNGSTADRAQEIARVRVEKPDLSYPDRRRPKFVPAADYNFDATRLPKDDPAFVWPVFLGQVTSTGTVTQPAYTINPADRPYAGLVGEAVLAPSGGARLQIGVPLSTGKPAPAGTKLPPASGFAVFVPPAEEYKLAVDANGISLNGDSQLYGNLTINNGALEFVVGAATAPAVRPSETAQPWKIYLDPTARQLRIEMAAGPVAGASSVAIGAFDDDQKKFMPCFTVGDQCAVTIGGDLTVQGQIRDSSGKCPDIVSTGLTKEAKDFVLNGMLSGMGGSSTLLDRFFKNPAPGGAGDAIATALAENGGLLNDVATALKGISVAQATALRDRLSDLLSKP